MASLRAKYKGRADIAPSKDAPVMSEPPARTSMPPIDNSPPPPDISVDAQSEPVEQAARAAMKDRITELERAEAISQQPQPPQFASEPQEPSPLEQILATVPEGARGWLRAHPEYLGDPEKNAQIRHAHLVAARETGDEEFGPHYYERLEHHLGLRPQRQPQQSARQVAPRPAMQRHTSVSAPPTRDSISMATGRPTGGRVHLSGEEREFAAMLGLSETDYAAEKQRMLRTQQ
jgi:hypothetical protein